jgi:hypothetical protein
MNRKHRLAPGLPTLAVCLLLTKAFTIAYAQQAIVNMPSADITPKGKHFLMHETQTRAWNPGRYWLATNFYAYGIGRDTELALTSYNAGSPKSPDFSTGVGFKSAPKILKNRFGERDLRQTFGSMLIVNHRGLGVGHFSYTHTSFRAPKLDTRLTVGGWAGTRQLFKKNTGNVLAGVEQPVGHKMILLAEWFAGNHDFGFFIPGVLFHPAKDQFIVVAYKIPNNPRNGSPGFVLEYGLIF